MKTFNIDESFVENKLRSFYDKTETPISEEILRELSTDNVVVLAAFLGNPEGPLAGFLSGYAKVRTPIILENSLCSGGKLHAETKYVKFFYTVYHPPFVTNNMQTIMPFYLPKYDDNIEDNQAYLKHIREQGRIRAQFESMSWGAKGFWLHTPTKSLTGDDLDCRLFIRQVQFVSRKYNWSNTIKKNTKAQQRRKLSNEESLPDDPFNSSEFSTRSL